jgi:TPP-dependent pyruvate/acetoin dehydrogenase alpha subunit
MYAPDYGLMGTNGIVGAGIPLAAGSALSAQLRKSGQVTICFFGDGAVNSGSFHEGLNFAGIWNLPVIFVCENNLYATEMAFSRATRNQSVASRADAYCVPGIQVEGNDVMAVYAAAGEAIERARAGGGPALLECKTYRVVGHHEGDPGTGYRSKEEVEAWKAKDPLKMLREKALAAKNADQVDFDAIHHEVDAWLADAVEYSRSSPEPEASSVYLHS